MHHSFLRTGRVLTVFAIAALASSCGGGGADGTDDLAPLSIRNDAAFSGNWGLHVRLPGAQGVQVLTDLGGPVGFVQDNSPQDVPEYRARFACDLDGVALGAGERLEIFSGFSPDTNAQFRLFVGGGAQKELILQARNDSGSIIETVPGTQAVVPPGYQIFNVQWSAVSGSFFADVNGVAGPGINGLVNPAARIDVVRLGVLGGDLDDLSTDGFLRLDDFRGDRGSLPFQTVSEPCSGFVRDTGFVRYPGDDCAFGTQPGDPYVIFDGLPAGTTIEIVPVHRNIFCLDPNCAQPGGGLGGDLVIFGTETVFELVGTGSLAGFRRVIPMSIDCEVHTGPRSPSSGVQTFDTEMFQMSGSLPPGDPDFSELGIRAGQLFGLQSLGSATTTALPNGSFLVENFFDLNYEINFTGAAGSVLEGLGGFSSGTSRIELGADPMIFTDGFESGDLSAWTTAVP